MHLEGFTPLVTDVGERHPVTAGLTEAARREARTVGGDAEAAPWGRWFRHVEIEPLGGEVVITTSIACSGKVRASVRWASSDATKIVAAMMAWV